MDINTGSAASLLDFFNQELGGQSTILFASCGIPISQEERSGRKRDREFESLFLQWRVGSQLDLRDPRIEGQITPGSSATLLT